MPIETILGVAPYMGIHQPHTGALAVLDQDGMFESIHDLPVVRDHSTCFFEGAEFRRIVLHALKGRQGRAVVEEMSFQPQFGAMGRVCGRRRLRLGPGRAQGARPPRRSRVSPYLAGSAPGVSAISQ